MHRRVQESIIGGIGIGGGVGLERYYNQNSDWLEVIGATGIQSLSTFAMALSMIWVYEKGSENLPNNIPISWRKAILGFLSGTTSAGVNYLGQLKTGGSIDESIVMFALSISGIIVYEFEVIPKTKELIKQQIGK